MKDARLYPLADGSYLVVSPAGIETIVYRVDLDGHPMAVAGRLRMQADAIERAADATAVIFQPGVCRSAT